MDGTGSLLWRIEDFGISAVEATRVRMIASVKVAVVVLAELCHLSLCERAVGAECVTATTHACRLSSCVCPLETKRSRTNYARVTTQFKAPILHSPGGSELNPTRPQNSGFYPLYAEYEVKCRIKTGGNHISTEDSVE